MTRCRWLSILVVAAGLLAAGCGGDDDDGGGGEPTPAPAQTAEAEAPPEGAVEGTGYFFVPPDGWRDVTDDFDESAIRVDRAFAAPDRQGGFRSNVNVIREDVGAKPGQLDDYAEALSEQTADLATDAGLSEIEEITLDGVPARTWTYEVRRRQPPRVRQRQVGVIHDGAVYTLTWSAAAARFDAEAPALDALLASWRWSQAGG